MATVRSCQSRSVLEIMSSRDTGTFMLPTWTKISPGPALVRMPAQASITPMRGTSSKVTSGGGTSADTDAVLDELVATLQPDSGAANLYAGVVLRVAVACGIGLWVDVSVIGGTPDLKHGHRLKRLLKLPCLGCARPCKRGCQRDEIQRRSRHFPSPSGARE